MTTIKSKRFLFSVCLILTVTLAVLLIASGRKIAEAKVGRKIIPLRGPALQIKLAALPKVWPEYTVNQVETSFDKVKKENRLSSTITIYRRADGATVQVNEFTSEDGTKRYERQTRYLDGTTIMSKDNLRRKTTYWSNGEPSYPLINLDPGKSCSSTYGASIPNTPTILGEAVIQGVRAIKLDGSYGFYQWRAPSLACEVLRQEWPFPEAINYKETTSIKMGPPDPAAFTVTDDYIETIPSEMVQAAANWRLLHDQSAHDALLAKLRDYAPGGKSYAALQNQDAAYTKTKQEAFRYKNQHERELAAGGGDGK